MTAATEITEEFHKKGYTILPGVFSKFQIESMEAEFRTLMENKVRNYGINFVDTPDPRKKDNSNTGRDFRPEGGNHDLNRWNMHLPSTEIFFQDSLIANKKVDPLIEEIVGTQAVLCIIASDTPYPGSGFQNIHQDFSRFGITVNIPLTDFNDENGPIEVWPGSHLKRGQSFHKGIVSLGKSQIKRIADEIQPKRLLLKKGDVLIRDQRLVHRGTANTSNSPRPCLSLWYKDPTDPGLLKLNIPTPNLKSIERVGQWAKEVRMAGPDCSIQVHNLGNFLGRLVDEISCSDRTGKRVIPSEIWSKLGTRAKNRLRFAVVEGHDSLVKRSISGSLILTAVGLGIVGAAWLNGAPGIQVLRRSYSDLPV